MPIYTTFEEIRAFNKRSDTFTILKEAFNRQYPNVFLSHSSTDHDSLPYVINIIVSHGGSVYIDDGDPRLPANVNPKTAAILRETIDKCKELIVLVSSKTKNSRWVPWELGLGDGKKIQNNVAIFPIVEEVNEYWPEQEYLGLYRKIVWSKFKGNDKSEWMVWDNYANKATALKEWLLS